MESPELRGVREAKRLDIGARREDRDDGAIGAIASDKRRTRLVSVAATVTYRMRCDGI